eukprot:TRINITY_DN155_c0_g1_i4.p1 TRINITY_DN155_c0_g1~~TRINITY_DN155_c0_g1_i4.p1  ORF type:complete len:448 (-),score=77.27 TRINITY_DN155_c0_g1_i4:16-1338(-)
MKHFVLILSLTFLLLNVAMSLAHSQPSDMRIHQLPEQKPLEDSNGDHHHCIHDHILTQSHPAPVTRQDYGVPDEVVHGAHAELAKRGPGALINEPYVHESGPTSRRLLNHVTFQGIRIYFYTVYMNSGQDNGRTCYNVGDSVLVYTGPTAPVNPPDCSSTVTSNCRLTCASEHVLTTTKKNFITANLLPDAKEFLEKALQVVPLAGNLVVNNGAGSNAGITIPLSHSTTGVSNTDMVIYVMGRPSLGATIAYAQALQADSTTGRPVVGYINWGPNQVDLSASKRKKQIAVAVHEIHHALGFSGNGQMGFGDPNFGKYTDYDRPSNITTVRQVTQVTTGAMTGTRSITKIVTPEVKRVMGEHFACTSVTGGEIEDGGGSGTGGSHWEKRVFNDEFMTGTVSAFPVLSKITLSLMFDSGWVSCHQSHISLLVSHPLHPTVLL